VDFDLPSDLLRTLAALDEFIDREIVPLQEEDDNARFFDHRREFARTDIERGGIPHPAWSSLLAEMERRADAAGWFRFALPEEVGGSACGNLAMAVIREHLTHRGLGLHNDLQDESSVVANMPFVHMLLEFGTDEQKKELLEKLVTREVRIGFGLTEPNHGSDATWLETEAARSGGDWVINGAKRFNSVMHAATHDLVFARTSGQPGESRGITAFLTPTDCPGLSVDHMWWTFNMPTDHAEVTLRNVRVPDSAILGAEGDGLAVAQLFLHENRIRQAASSLGAAQYCVDESVRYARARHTFGRALATQQAIQWPLVELQTEAEMLRGLVRKTAWQLDRVPHWQISDKVSMCNYRANRLACDAADRAMQVHGGMGYTRHLPFEHIYRHHRRYRITEGSEEVQMRKIAGYLFGFAGPNKGIR
jgi:alkylation response protein AidB-like acyl-CoA dehydrogenase